MADDDGEVSGSPTQDDLQFDRADFAEPAEAVPSCKRCGREIPDAYYEFRGAVFCQTCADQIRVVLTGGSGLGRFVRATFFGTAAAAAGCALYLFVVRVIGHLSLIFILVGLMVGVAVRNASRGRGGLVYQALAIFLTYSAIAASFGAEFMVGMSKDARAKHAVAKKADANVDPAKAEPGEPAPPADVVKPTSVLGWVLLVAVGLVFLYAVPIIAGYYQPIGLLIIGFALWEAWKLNRRGPPLTVNGPFLVGAAGGGHAGEVAGHA
jgi:hypothetical protein